MSRLDELQENIMSAEAIDAQGMASNATERVLGRVPSSRFANKEPDYEWEWLYSLFLEVFERKKGYVVLARREEFKARLRTMAESTGIKLADNGPRESDLHVPEHVAGIDGRGIL